LIDGDDIGNLSGLIEGVFLERQPNSLQELLSLVNEKFTGRSRPWEHELRLPEYTFPVLEGLHKTASTWWLGIYRRNYTFPLACLEAMAQLCAVTKIGKIDITPHKTILIKGIREQDCLQWKKLLGLYGVNSRHSIVELNWQLPDLDSEALELKKALVNELEEKEVCTAGMSFAIETRPIEVATSVLIKPKFYKEHEEKALYTIQHTVDFSAHTSQWQMFADQVDRHQLAPALLQLCQVYYRQLGTAHASTEADEIPLLLQTHNKYQCPDCLTVYDPLYGDASSGIVANVAFDELPEVYSCSMCESPKSNFVLMSSHEL
jgi:rubredoxin